MFRRFFKRKKDFYFDVTYCDHCNKDTKQKITENCYEREDRSLFECLECGWIKIGMGGDYNEGYEEC